MLTIVALGATAAIVNPPPASNIHRAPASIDVEAAKIELDQCLALARLEVPEDYPYADEQPTAEDCYNAYFRETLP